MVIVQYAQGILLWAGDTFLILYIRSCGLICVHPFMIRADLFGMRSNRPLKNRSALRSASSSLPRIRSGASSAAYRSTPQSLLLLALLVSRLRLVSHAPHQVRGRLDLFDLYFGLRG